MNLIFRKLDPANDRDVRQFSDLMDQLTQRARDEQLLRAKIAQTNANEDACLLVAEDTDAGVLCASALAVSFGDFCDTCRPIMVIENVVTHRDYRGRGVGRRIIAEIEAWGRSRDVCYAILCSSLSREDAHRFYRAIGYADVKGFKKYL